MTMTEMVDGLPDLPTPSDIDDGVLHVFDELDAPEGEPSGDGFRVLDEGQADWALRKLTAVRSSLADADALATRQIEAILAMVEPYLSPIREWHEAQSERLGNEIGFWEGLLELYHRDVVLADDPKAKTVTLPHGTLKARKSPDRWEFDEAFLDWARNIAPEFIRTKEEADKALAKKTLKVAPNGHAVYDLPQGPVDVPSVTVTPGDISFTVETEVGQ
jgi:phage host-nuclease inhibitor protein Gam